MEIQKDSNQAEKFLDMVFGGALFYIWSPGRRGAQFFTNVEIASEYALDIDDNTYFSCGISEKKVTGRGTEQNIIGIPGLWSDIDYGAAGHKKKNLPANEQEAREFLNMLPFCPTLIVHSGNGLQAYWLFMEAWLFENDEDRQQAKKLTTAWHDLQLHFASERDWTLDSVYDLTRVLRLPGTINCKDRDNLKEVKIIEETGMYYDPQDILAIAEPHLKPRNEKVTTSTGGDPNNKIDLGFPVSEHVAPDQVKFWALYENSQLFKLTWRGSRKNMQDSSPSAYDLSITTQAAAAGWNKQELIKLMIARRKCRGDDLKLNNLQYYERTALRAINDTSPQREIESLSDAINGKNAPVSDDIEVIDSTIAESGQKLSASQRGVIISSLASVLQLPLKKWIQRGREPKTAQFSMILTNDEEVLIGKAASVLNVSHFKAAIYTGCQKVLPPMKTDKWMKVCEGLASIVHLEEIAMLDRDKQIRGWIKDYCCTCHLEYTDHSEAVATGQPFLKDGELYFQAASLIKHIRLVLHEFITPADVYNQLAMIGFNRRTMGYKIDNEKTSSKSYYVGPADLMDDETKNEGLDNENNRKVD